MNLESLNYIIGSICLLTAILLRLIAPKKRIWWYGYRTSSSMKSDASYIYGNKISGNLIFMGALLYLLLSFFFMNYFGGRVLLISGVFILLICILLSEIKVRKFNKENGL